MNLYCILLLLLFLGAFLVVGCVENYHKDENNLLINSTDDDKKKELHIPEYIGKAGYFEKSYNPKAQMQPKKFNFSKERKQVP